MHSKGRAAPGGLAVLVIGQAALVAVAGKKSARKIEVDLLMEMTTSCRELIHKRLSDMTYDDLVKKLGTGEE